MRGATCAWLVSSLLLAGCSGSGSGSDDPVAVGDVTDLEVPGNATAVAAQLPAPPVVLTVSDCQLHAYNFPIQPAQVEPFLPPGFEWVPFGVGPDTGMANAVIVLAECEGLSNGTGELGPFVEMRMYVGVSVPDEWEGDEFGGYRLVVAHATDNDALAAQLTAWGIPTTTDAQVALGITDFMQGQAIQDDASGPFTVSANAAAGSLGAGAAGDLRFIYAQDAVALGAIDEHLEGTARGMSAAVQLQVSGAPFGNGSQAGNAGIYDWAGVPAFSMAHWVPAGMQAAVLKTA